MYIYIDIYIHTGVLGPRFAWPRFSLVPGAKCLVRRLVPFGQETNQPVGLDAHQLVGQDDDDDELYGFWC